MPGELFVGQNGLHYWGFPCKTHRSTERKTRIPVSTLLCLYATFVLAVDVQVYPSVLTKIGSNSMQQSLLLSSLFLLFPLSSVLSGVMSDRIGKKAVLITGRLFLTLPFAISLAFRLDPALRLQSFLWAVAVGTLTLVIGFFFLRAGMGTVWPTFVAMIGRRFKQSSGLAVGLIIAVGGLAVPIMHRIIGVLSREEMFGLRYTLLGLGIFTLGNMFVVRRIEQLEKGGAGGV